MPNAIDVVGQLSVEMGGGGMARVEARGETIVVELPSLRAGLATLRRWPGGRSRRAASIGRIHDVLTAAGLSLSVRAGPATIGRLGVGARPGLASRLLALGPMEILVDGLIPRRRRAPTPES